MLRMLEAQAPTKQTATETISTLSNRLSSATLLEDRRAAILGLRSFAKEFPASVASGSLRDLISELGKDAEDVDTIKVVLETLLMLFNPNEHSPEASEEITLWLADEFTQRQENITILLDLLEAQDFYSRLYSIQLLAAISTLRPERTQECILSAPLGTTRLVATLDDRRDAIRNAGLLLLTDLTQSSQELQKLVAFENAFERLFALVELEGSVAEGGIIIQDCLSLLANLVRHNPSNQSLFRETGCTPRLCKMFAAKTVDLESGGAQWVNPQKDKNTWGLLAVVRLFLSRGSTSTQLNQNTFQKSGLLQLVLDLAFSDTAAPSIRAEALRTCADIIRGNASIQESFAHFQVSAHVSHRSQANGTASLNGHTKIHVIDALLKLILSDAEAATFDSRFASYECVKAYCQNHKQICLHFLGRAVDGHKSHEADDLNIVSILIRGPHDATISDPYRFWFSAVLLSFLMSEDDEAKRIIMAIVEGNIASGEETVTCIQVMSGNLLACLQRGDDERITVAYLMLLCCWFFESPDAINDFLGESSSLQVLMQTASRTSLDSGIIRGICAVLVGIIYEFSTKDSAVPRRKLQPLILSSLGRERYLEALTSLRQNRLIRDFEVLTQGNLGMDDNVSDVIFDATFVDFFKDNYSRLSRAIDRDPGLEVNLTQDGVDRDLVDALRTQLEDKSSALQKAETEAIELGRKLDQVETDHRKSSDQAVAEHTRIRSINEALQQSHAAEVAKNEEEHKVMLANMEAQFRQQYQALQAQLQQVQKQTSDDTSKAREHHQRQLSDVTRAKVEAQEKFVAIERRAAEMSRSLAELRGQFDSTKAALELATKNVEALETKVKERDEKITSLLDMAQRSTNASGKIRSELRDFQNRVEEAEKKARDNQDEAQTNAAKAQAAEEAKAEAEAETHDLLIMLADLEEKRAKDKKRLKELGEDTSDAEEDNLDGHTQDGDESGSEAGSEAGDDDELD